jgi:hypothetical protein
MIRMLVGCLTIAGFAPLAAAQRAPAGQSDVVPLQRSVDTAVEIDGDRERGMAPRSGEFFWQQAGRVSTVRNVGTTRIDLVEIELK